MCVSQSYMRPVIRPTATPSGFLSPEITNSSQAYESVAIVWVSLLLIVCRSPSIPSRSIPSRPRVPVLLDPAVQRAKPDCAQPSPLPHACPNWQANPPIMLCVRTDDAPPFRPT